MRRPLPGLVVLCAFLFALSNLSGAQAAPKRVKPPIARSDARASYKFAKLRPAISSKPLRRPYTLATTWQHATANGGVTLLGAAVAGYFATNGWNRNDPRSFHMQREGWFGRDTYAGGVDKLGHFYAANVLSDVFAWTLRQKGFDPYESAASGAVTSWFLMTAIETGDGFSHFGFSPEDMTFNTLGAAFSFLRNTVPGLREKLDFRVQYIPSGNKNFSGDGDYSNKKFLFALKLAGFDKLKDTPWRFVELHAGYFARGFSDTERALGRPMERHLYAGIGLNLSEILFSTPTVRGTWAGQAARGVLEYVQVPYTAINSRN